MSDSPAIGGVGNSAVRPEGTRRSLLVVLLAIPVTMLLISAILFAIKSRAASPGLPWVYTESNISALSHARLLEGNDSWYPMLAAREWLRAHHGGDVYQALFFNQRIKYQYPNTSLFLIQWLPADRAVATRMLNLVNFGLAAANVVGMMLLMSALVDRMTTAGWKISARKPILVAIGGVATICYFPFVKALSIGQMQVLLDLLFTAACYFIVRAKPGWSGAMVGLSMLVKPQMGLLLVWAVIGRQMRFAVGLLAVAVTGFVLSLVAYGFEWPFGYLRVLGFLGTYGESYFGNQSVNGIVNRLLDNGVNVFWFGQARFAPYNAVVYAATLISTIVFVLLGVASGLWRGKGAVVLPSFLVASICFTLASPIAWHHHYAILLPAFAYCLIAQIDREAATGHVSGFVRGLLAIMFVVSANAFSMVNLLAETPLNFLQSYLFFAALGTLALVATLARSDSDRVRAFGRMAGGRL